MYISELIITGFKKFQEFSIKFNKDVNVLIGENEEGKSTILEAIDVVLNQKYFLNQNQIFDQLFNVENVEIYKSRPCVENLPRIEIELYLHSEDKHIDEAYFNGGHCSKGEILTGIKFTYSFDESYRQMFEDRYSGDDEIFIPTEFYIATWKTFAGHKYLSKQCPLKNILIDSSIRRNNIYNSYSKKVYNNNFEEVEKQFLSHDLRRSLQDFLNNNDDKLNINEYTLGLDDNKTILENLLDLKSEGVSIQNKGKGKESLIKTEIALEIDSDLIMIEEPENHLSYINTRKLLDEIQEKGENNQLIITTHNPLVVSRLNLQNTLWIKNEDYSSFKNIPDETAEFFKRSDNMQVLNFILSERVIIVEGNSEYIMIPQLMFNSLGKSLESENIELLSGGGITYQHYINLTKVIQNKLLVLTDNDGEEETIIEIKKQNEAHAMANENINIVCSEEIEKFTFEICIYYEAKEILIDLYKVKPNTTTLYREKVYDRALAYMLKNKTEAALRIIEEEQYKDKVTLPQYIKEGIEWLIQK